MSTSSIFLTFTDKLLNRKVRIQSAHIVAYGSRFLPDTNETVTEIYLSDKELAVLFVDQSPEQIDQLLQESYITVKSEQ